MTEAFPRPFANLPLSTSTVCRSRCCAYESGMASTPMSAQPLPKQIGRPAAHSWIVTSAPGVRTPRSRHTSTLPTPLEGMPNSAVPNRTVQAHTELHPRLFAKVSRAFMLNTSAVILARTAPTEAGHAARSASASRYPPARRVDPLPLIICATRSRGRVGRGYTTI